MLRSTWLLVLLGTPARASMKDEFDRLPFNASHAPAHHSNISVGVFFEHLFKVDQIEHTFSADFWLVYRWHDSRNFTSLFRNASGYHDHVELPTGACSTPTSNAHGRRTSDDGDGRTSAAELRRRLSASTASSSGPYIEFGHGDLNLLWHPDLHLRNAHQKSPRVHAELFRFFEDGTVEQFQLKFAELELQHPFYGAYPFDTQTLTVQVESMAHTTRMLTLDVLTTFSGVNQALVHLWPGWALQHVHARSDAVEPSYVSIQGNEHLCERRSRYNLDVSIKREVGTMRTEQLGPVMLLTIVTWTAFFIDIKVLMPRVAVGFISFLTLSNMANAMTVGLPAVSYNTWINVFFTTHRLFVVLSLIETASAVWITDNLSTRVGLQLDNFAKVAVPLSYFCLVVMLFVFGAQHVSNTSQYGDQLKMIESISFVVTGSLILSAVAWCVWSYAELKRQLRTQPLKTYMQAIDLRPLDVREVRLLFQALDSDGSGILTIEEVVMTVLDGMSDHGDVDRAGCVKLIERLKINPAFQSDLTLPKFLISYRAVLDEVDFLKQIHRQKAVASVPTSLSSKNSRRPTLENSRFPTVADQITELTARSMSCVGDQMTEMTAHSMSCVGGGQSGAVVTEGGDQEQDIERAVVEGGAKKPIPGEGSSISGNERATGLPGVMPGWL